MKLIANKKYRINKKTFLLTLIAIILIIIAGGRPIGIDRDMNSYINMIKTYESIFKANFLIREPMFNLILEVNRIIFGGSIRGFFYIYAILGVGFKIHGIKKLSLLPLLSTFFYMSEYFILHEMTQIRVGVGVGVFLLTIPDIYNRNFKRFIYKSVIAILFHYSMVIILPLYFINPIKFSKSKYFILIGIGLASSRLQIMENALFQILKFLPNFLSYKLDIYLNSYHNTGINLFNFKILSIIFIYIILSINYKKLKGKYDIILLKILGLSLFLFFILSFSPVLAFRISDILFISVIILLPNLITIIKNKNFAWLIMFFYSLILLINTLFIQDILIF